MPRTAIKTPVKPPVVKNPVGRPKKTASTNKLTITGDVPQEVGTKTARARAMKAHPSSTTKKAVASPKSSPVKKAPENRIVASDNPNLLDPSKDGTKKISGMTYKQLSEQLGFGIGTEQFLAAIELLKGGETRSEINDRVKELLPTHTVNGTPKQVTNLVSGVHNSMIRKGFRVSGSYKLVQVK